MEAASIDFAERESVTEILLVDDRPENLTALAAILEAPDRRIVSVRSGPEALRRMLEHDFAVVLLDIQMPEMDGFEVLRLMRARRRTASTPVIFVTGVGRTPQHLFAGYEAGAVDYLVKPLDPHVVRCKVDVFLELHRQRAQLERQSNELAALNADLERRVANRTRELKLANLQLETFVYSASHNLRTPLRSIEGMVAIVLEEEASHLERESRRMLDRVADCAYHMSELLQALLRLSGLRHGTVDIGPVDLAGLARASVASRLASAPERRVQVRIPDSLPAVADESLARLILDVLIENAWKFTRQQPDPRIEIGVVPDPENPEEKAWFVRDNGIGFEMAHVDKLFHVFQRLHGPKDLAGPGLGLATLRQAVELHGGRTWAESQLGRGATFYFTLGSP